MRRFTTEYPTAKATKSAIAKLEKEIEAMANVPGDVIDYTTAVGIIKDLSRYKARLERDLGHQEF